MNREDRKKKEAFRKQKRLEDLAKRQFHVAVDIGTGDVQTFTNPDGIVTTYGSVGPRETKFHLVSLVKKMQDKTVMPTPVKRKDLYTAALLRLPANGIHLLGMATKTGDMEMLPLTPVGAKFLRENNFLVPELLDQTEVMLYLSLRLATLEFGRKFEDMAAVSKVMPDVEGLFEDSEDEAEEPVSESVSQ